jgi:DNA-binding protein H-NS
VSQRHKQDLRAKLSALAAKSGLSLKDIVSGMAKRRGRPLGRKTASVVSAKYRNPKNPSQTWAGRGRRPLWLAKAANIERYKVA